MRTKEFYRYNNKNSHISIFTPNTLGKIFKDFEVVESGSVIKPKKKFFGWPTRTAYLVLRKGVELDENEGGISESDDC